LDVRFSTAIRGYDRDEVDGYIKRVNEVLAELQITKTPETAVQRALERVDREKQSVIEEARGAAEEITARSRSRADDRIQEAIEEGQRVREAATQEANEMRKEAEREAREMREAVEQRIRELETHVEEMLEKRARVIEELRVLAGHIDEFVDGEAADRDPTPVPAQADGAG
jgi:DivIVA domain-containing protein